jgi:hypothetical protein
MAHDLLSVQEERYKYSYTGNNNQTLSKEVLLNDTDPLYRRLKHMHIAELSTLLHAEYKGFLESNKSSAALSKGNANNVRATAEGSASPWPALALTLTLTLALALTLTLITLALTLVTLTLTLVTLTLTLVTLTLTTKPAQVRAMAEGLKAMPKFQEETARYSLHIHVVGELTLT